MSKHDLE